VILGREAAVTVLRMAVLHHGVIPASRGGKVKTVAQTVLIVLALSVSQWTALLATVIAATVAWTVVTGLDYGVKAGALTRARAVPVPASPGAPRQQLYR
jgi:CDP-diacylglycerol--glycerol-3-phosphate 3-phosphatidyltransferase